MISFRLGLFVCLIVGNIVSLLTGRQKVDDLAQGVLTPLFHRSFLCKWMPDNVKQKSIPPQLLQAQTNLAFKDDESTVSSL